MDRLLGEASRLALFGEEFDETRRKKVKTLLNKHTKQTNTQAPYVVIVGKCYVVFKFKN